MAVERKQAAARVKPSMKVGAVAILVRGEYAGKRVIVLRVCDNGRILVSAPYGENPMSLSLVEQKSLIGTSTSVKLDGVDAASVDLKVLKRVPVPKPQDITDQKGVAPKTQLPAEYKAAAEKIDGALVSVFKSLDAIMQDYLKAPFDLNKTLGVPPHKLKF